MRVVDRPAGPTPLVHLVEDLQLLLAVESVGGGARVEFFIGKTLTGRPLGPAITPQHSLGTRGARAPRSRRRRRRRSSPSIICSLQQRHQRGGIPCNRRFRIGPRRPVTVIVPGGPRTVSPIVGARERPRPPGARRAQPWSGPRSAVPPDVCASASTSCSARRARPSRRTGRRTRGCAGCRPGRRPARAQVERAVEERHRRGVIRAATPEAEQHLGRCPSRPNPVTSVAASAPASSIASDAPRFSVVMTSTAARDLLGGRLPALDRRRDDAEAERLGQEQLRAGARGRVARRSDPGGRARSRPCPYFGSGSSIECPPTTGDAGLGRRRRRRLGAPAPSISSGRSSTGHATMLSARDGRPPIA